MTTIYRTVVLRLPPTPMGLLPERWTIEHRCNLCFERVAPEELIAHAQHHQPPAGAGESFQLPDASGTLAPDHGPTENATTAPGIPSASMTTNDQRRR